MNIKLNPSILEMDGRLIEVYERITQAPEDKLNELKLNNGNPVVATIGVARIPEYLILQTSNINAGSFKTWSLSRVNQALVIKSLYIDAPQADRLDFEILLQGQKIFDFYLNRTKTPYEFPPAPLPSDVSIRIKALSEINFLQIVLQPAVILDTLLADEDLEPER